MGSDLPLRILVVSADLPTFGIPTTSLSIWVGIGILYQDSQEVRTRDLGCNLSDSYHHNNIIITATMSDCGSSSGLSDVSTFLGRKSYAEPASELPDEPMLSSPPRHDFHDCHLAPFQNCLAPLLDYSLATYILKPLCPPIFLAGT